MRFLFSRKGIVSVTVVGLLFLGGFAYWYWQRQEVTLEQNTVPEKSFSQQSSDNEDEDGESLEVLGIDPEDGETFATPENETEARTRSAFVVNSEVCRDECIQYQNDTEGMKYCRAVCGLAESEGAGRPKPENCDGLTETERDICLRDKAVTQRDPAVCEDITDQNLRTACHNRIAEEQFDE